MHYHQTAHLVQSERGALYTTINSINQYFCKRAIKVLIRRGECEGFSVSSLVVRAVRQKGSCSRVVVPRQTYLTGTYGLTDT